MYTGAWLVWLFVMGVVAWAFYTWGAREYRSRRHRFGSWDFGPPPPAAEYGLAPRFLTEVPGPHHGRGPSGYRRRDERIAEDINDSMTMDGELDATEIAVTVREGRVTLEGVVASRRQRRRAEAIAESVAGVTDVDDLLRVAAGASEGARARTRQLPGSDNPSA